jgi:outer membrane biosynthesis protein TonB
MKGIKSLLLCGAAALSALLLAAGGCTRAQARVVPELPPLDVPAPPPRIVEAVEPEPPPLPAEPQEQPVRIAPPRPRVQTPVQRAEPPKPEPPKVEIPAPPEPPRPADESKQPQGTLQTTPAGREAQLERSIKDMLGRAMTNLNRVDYGGLNADARTQYDQARRFISQAQDALREKNLVFAENLADKANTLAAQLAGR